MTDVVAVLSIPIEADPRKIEASIRKVEQDLARVGNTKANLGGSFDAAVPAIQRAERQTVAFAQARARLLRDTGDLAGAERVLQGALDGTTASTVQTLSAQRQLAQVQDELKRGGAAAAGSFGQLSGALGSIQGILGAAGFAIGADQVFQFAASAVQAANSLEKTQALVRAMTGDQATYAEVTTLAAQQQRQFGGSIEPILAGLGRLAPLARNTNLEIGELSRALQLLALASPEQGIDGANIALREFLTGTGYNAAQSLALRFELDRQALQELTAEGVTAQQRMAGLFELLSAQGYTLDALTAQTETTANSYDRLGASLSNLQAIVGAVLAEGFQPAAEQLGLIADASSELAQQIAAGVGPVEALNQAALASAGSAEEYRATLARSLEVTRDFVQNSSVLQSLLGANKPLFDAAAAGAVNYFQNVFRLTDAEAEAAIAAQGLASESDAAALALQRQGERSAATADASQQAAAAANEDALATIRQGAEAGVAAARQAELERALAAAAAGSETSGAAAARLAGIFVGVEAPAIQEVIDLLRQKAQLEGVGAVAVPREVSARRAAQQATAAQKQLQIDLVNAVGTTAQRLAVVNQQLAAGNLTAEERNRLIIQQAQLQQQLGQQQGRAAEQAQARAERDAKQRLDGEQRTAEQLRAARERYYERAADAERTYQEQVLDIVERYAERQLAAQRDLQAGSASSRAGFYDALTQAEIPEGAQQSLSAQYEAIFAEAQRLSQEGKAQLAADYLALKEEQLRAELAYQEKVAALRAKLADGDATAAEKTAAQAEIDRLAAIKALQDAAYQARESNLQDTGDQNVAERDQGLQDAAVEREQALRDAAVEAGDAQTEAQRKAAEQAGAYTLQLAEQLRLLDEIARRGGGGVPGGITPPGGLPATGATVPLPALPATGATAPLSPPAAPTPAPPDLIAALAELRAAVVERLDAIIPAAVGTQGATAPLAGGLSDVAAAVERVRGAVEAAGERAPFGTGA